MCFDVMVVTVMSLLCVLCCMEVYCVVVLYSTGVCCCVVLCIEWRSVVDVIVVFYDQHVIQE